jgi:hypothetical protein
LSMAVPSPTTSALLPQVNILFQTKFVFKSLNNYTFMECWITLTIFLLDSIWESIYTASNLFLWLRITLKMAFIFLLGGKRKSFPIPERCP